MKWYKLYNEGQERGNPITCSDIFTYDSELYMHITGRGDEGKYCSGTIQFLWKPKGKWTNNDFLWQFREPEDSKPLSGYYENHYQMISQGTTRREALNVCNKVKKMINKDPYMNWDQLLKKVEAIVDEFRKQKEDDGFETSGHPWWYGKSDHGRD